MPPEPATTTPPAPAPALRAPFRLGPMPMDRHMITVDERIVRAPRERIFRLAADVARWPDHLAHYRFVRFREHARDGGGLVEMSANRPFGPANWPTWWLSRMAVDESVPNIRFLHVGGITTDMDVEWQFVRRPTDDETLVRIVHVWNGPGWPLIGRVAAQAVIGPVFVHGIASRTLEGLARAAERGA